jgi:hypothetical protein
MNTESQNKFMWNINDIRHEKKLWEKNINEIRLKYPKLIKDNSFGLFFV